MKILFIQGDPFYRLGVMALAAYLEKHGGHRSEVLISRDVSRDGETIRNAAPDLIGFYVTSPEAGWVRRVARELRSRFETPIVVGGPHPTFEPAFLRHPEIDFGIRGEAEQGLLGLLQHLSGSLPREQVDNLVYRGDDGSILCNAIAPLIEPLDQLPAPSWRIYGGNRVTRRYYRFAFPVIVGRGCPGTCSFCCMNELRELYRDKGRFIRIRSPEHVIEELTAVTRDFPVDRLMFEDDSFLLKKDWLETFAGLYRTAIGLPFTCQAMASLITPKTADLLKSMGCRAVRVGLETGDEQLRRTVLRKHISDRQLLEAARLLHERGIKVQTYNMFGIPGETVENTMSTWSLNRAMKTDFAWSSQLRPFPGTTLLLQTAGAFDSTTFWDENAEIGNYFTSSARIPISSEAENMQQFIQLFLMLRLSSRQVRFLIGLSRLRSFHWFFSLVYALSVRKINRIPFMPFFMMALAARRYIHKQ